VLGCFPSTVYAGQTSGAKAWSRELFKEHIQPVFAVSHWQLTLLRLLHRSLLEFVDFQISSEFCPWNFKLICCSNFADFPIKGRDELHWGVQVWWRCCWHPFCRPCWCASALPLMWVGNGATRNDFFPSRFWCCQHSVPCCSPSCLWIEQQVGLDFLGATAKWIDMYWSCSWPAECVVAHTC